MTIYMIQEGIADYNILYSFGAYPTKEKAEKSNNQALWERVD